MITDTRQVIPSRYIPVTPISRLTVGADGNIPTGLHVLLLVLHKHLLRPKGLTTPSFWNDILSDLGHVIEILCLLCFLMLYRDETSCTLEI